MQEALAERGAVSTIKVASTEKAELPGCELDLFFGRGRVRPIFVWRLAGPLDYLLNTKCRMVSGREMERILGHIVAACMLKPESLAMLSASYTFAESSGLKRLPLWASVQQELMWARSLLPCIVGDMR